MIDYSYNFINYYWWKNINNRFSFIEFMNLYEHGRNMDHNGKQIKQIFEDIKISCGTFSYVSLIQTIFLFRCNCIRNQNNSIQWSAITFNLSKIYCGILLSHQFTPDMQFEVPFWLNHRWLQSSIVNTEIFVRNPVTSYSQIISQIFCFGRQFYQQKLTFS